MTPEHLFVYGTLRRDSGSELHRLLKNHGQHVGGATFQGRLYLVADYPGAVRSSRAGDRVVGEVYGLLDPEHVLTTFDAYEECGPEHSQPTEYVRSRERVRMENGDSIEAWIYLYNRPTDGLLHIVSGDFLKPGR